jgi:hypothetical protein
VTFTATVAPVGPNSLTPTGTVTFYLDGSRTPIAVETLVNGQASFTTSGLGAGNHNVTAVYSGDKHFLASSSSTSAVTTTVGCTNTITGNVNGSLVLGPGSTCVLNATVGGSITVPKGSLLDLENSTVTGSINASKAAFVRICGSSASSVTISSSTGPVVVGDAGDGCAVNTFSGSLTVLHNTHGVQVIGNHVAGAVTASGNSGAGPFPSDTSAEVSGNGH